MKKASLFLAGVVLATAALAQGPGPEAAAWLKAETDRLQQALQGKSSTDPNWKDLKPRIERALARARKAFDAGYLYYGLEELDVVRSAFRSVEVMVDVKAVMAKDSLAGFDREWQSLRQELVTLDQQAHARNWNGKPVALRALSEAVQGTTIILADTGRATAHATQGVGGPYNLGEARAAAEFAALCHALPASRPPAPLPLRSLRPELDRMQERANAAFKPPRSIELHPKFIALNAAIKQAGELDAAGFHAGALYLYLDAVQQFALLDAVPPGEAGRTRLRESVAALLAKNKHSQRDDSIAQLFLERAQALMAGKNEEPASPEDWAAAAVIAEQVLPAYEAVLRAAPARRPEQMAAASAVTVTLVRWPYT